MFIIYVDGGILFLSVQTTQWPREEGQTTQWPREEGQTTQWPTTEIKGQTNNDQQNSSSKTEDRAN